MAEKDNKTNVTHADFVGKIVKDPKSPPDTILLTGYLGKSSEDGHTRLYCDPELKNYVEIPNDAILHSQQIPEEQSGLGGAHVWIKSDAEVIHGKVGPSRTKAKFFEGPIAAGAAAAGMGGAGPFPLTQFNCPTHAPELCPQTLLPPCPSPLHHCAPSPPPLLCPHTPLHGCQPTPLCTHVFTQCHTPLHGCPTPPALCIPTHVFTQCHTPLHGCPTPPAFCPPTPPHICPTPTAVNPPLCTPPVTPLCQTTLPACIPHLTQGGPQCVASPAPGCGIVFDPGGPVEQPAFAGQAAFALRPSIPCPTQPAQCFFPTHHFCLTHWPGCHTQFPGCHFPTPGCPF